MPGAVKINGKILNIQVATERLNNMGLAVGKFSEAMHVINLEFPFVVAIISGDSCEGSIRGSSQEIAEAEAV
ncbi:MAG: hypothetical protein WB392_13000 [Methanotrichaceae archaeon]